MALRILRQKPRISYFEPEEPSLDEYVFCEKCADYVYEYCSIHGALLVVPDDKVPAKSNFPSFVPKAALTIPHVFLHLNYSTIPGAGLGVFTSLTLPSGVRFGPYRGERTNDITSDYSWQIYDRNRKPSHVVDASNGNKSNWMRYVNCARHWSEQNLVAFQYQGHLYYRTIKIVPRFTELMVFYGSEYANRLHIDLRKYNSPRCFAQKFGAPAPKKPKFSVSKKPQVLKRLNDNKDRYNLITPNATVQEISKTETFGEKKQHGKETLAPKIPKFGVSKKPQELVSKPLKENKEKHNLVESNAVLQESLKTKTCVKNKRQSQKGSPASKKRKIDEKDKTFQPENLGPVQENSETDKESTDTKYVHEKASPSRSSLQNEKDSNNEREKNSKIPSKKQNVGQKTKKDDILYFMCNVCNYQSIIKNGLEKHMNFHDVNRKFACGICSYKFSTSLRLISHELRWHGIKSSTTEIYECNMCDFTTVDKFNLKKHILKHTGEKPYSCDICDYKFKRANNLKTHQRTHTGEKPYACYECDYKSTQASSLKTHLRTHTGEKPYACNECDYKSTQASSLKTHLRTHTGEKPYACNECDYKSTQASDLKTHLRTHTGEKPYACNECDYKSTQASSLKTHLRTHTGEKPYACNECDYKSTQASDLKTHLRTHTGEKPYACNECDYKFSVASNLKTHLRTHTGEKPYVCSECDYKSTQASSLKTHLSTHTGEKPYACSECDYKSIQASHLRKHIRTHTGEKPYSCDICDYKYKHKISLNNHLKSKHLN